MMTDIEKRPEEVGQILIKVSRLSFSVTGRFAPKTFPPQDVSPWSFPPWSFCLHFSPLVVSPPCPSFFALKTLLPLVVSPPMIKKR